MKKALKFVFLIFLFSSCLADKDGTFIEGQMLRIDNNEPVAGQKITIQGIEKIRRLIPLGPKDRIATTNAAITDDLGKFETLIEYNKNIQYYDIRVESILNTNTGDSYWCHPPQITPSDSLQPGRKHTIDILITCPTYIQGTVNDVSGKELAGIEVVAIGFSTGREIYRESSTTDEDGQFYFPVGYLEEMTDLIITVENSEFTCNPAICDQIALGERSIVTIIIAE